MKPDVGQRQTYKCVNIQSEIEGQPEKIYLKTDKQTLTQTETQTTNSR